jgi:hypothetical protein
MLDQVLQTFAVAADYDLNLMHPGHAQYLYPGAAAVRPAARGGQLRRLGAALQESTPADQSGARPSVRGGGAIIGRCGDDSGGGPAAFPDSALEAGSLPEGRRLPGIATAGSSGGVRRQGGGDRLGVPDQNLGYDRADRRDRG